MLVKSLELRRQLDNLNAARSVRRGLRLYDVKVRPSAVYGSCVWATRLHMVSPTSAVIHNELEKRHVAFLRSWCHLRGSKPSVYGEPGRLPLHYFRWRDIVRFANRVLQLPDDSLWKEMMQDSHQSHQGGRKCWAGDLAKFLQNLGMSLRPNRQLFMGEGLVLEALCQQYACVYGGLTSRPRQAADKVKMATYLTWVDLGAWLRRPTYLCYDFPALATCTYLCFRLGLHGMQIELGRWQNWHRCERLCRRCAMNSVDDEWNMVFNCPAFECLRSARRHLFSRRVMDNMPASMK